jgi:segregation and condensation protein B
MASEEPTSNGAADAGDASEEAVRQEQAQALEAEQVLADSKRSGPVVAEADRAAAIEALCFAAAEPLSPARLGGIVGLRPSEVKALAVELNARYESAGGGLRLEQVAGGWQMVTRSDLQPVLRRLRGPSRDARMSTAALETLAIVAYRQPVKRADVSDIRGVDPGPIMKTLQERGLVRVVGRAEELGNPLLYSTTRAFLEHFGLDSLKELPTPEAPAT